MAYSVTLEKGKNNMIGISIGGGAPYCPVVYIVQVFHRTPAYADGSLCPGDELVAVNEVSLRGHSRKQTADIIQGEKGVITIKFNRIQPPNGRNFGIAMKKLKHKVVERMKDTTADSLGITRAVLVNDKLLQKLDHLERTSKVYEGIAHRAKQVLTHVNELALDHSSLGQVFTKIGVYEQQQHASTTFTNFGNAHKMMGDEGRKLIAYVGPMLKDLNTFLRKAVPDTRLTIKKYQEAKFEFLAYCLKVKELDDEEYEFAQLGQPLARVIAGNLEYRVFLRCRHAAKTRFMKLRADVQVKLQLLDNKRVQDLAFQLERLVAGMYVYTRQCYKVLKPAAVFPIEVQLGVDLLPPRKETAEEEDDDDAILSTNGEAVVGEEEKENVKEEEEEKKVEEVKEEEKEEESKEIKVVEGELIALN